MIAKPEHEVAFRDITDLMRKHSDKVDAVEMLAIAANVVGKLVALQDGRTITPDMAMEIVLRNIEIGNKQAWAPLEKTEGSA